jgi:hypothetical protein
VATFIDVIGCVLIGLGFGSSLFVSIVVLCPLSRLLGKSYSQGCEATIGFLARL